MRIINCTVNQEYVVGAGVVVGASGSHDSTALRLTFGEEWDDLSIYVSWKDSLGEQTAFSLITNDLKDEEGAYIVPIPAEPLKHEGSMMMTLVGYTLEDGIETSAKVSAVAYFRVLQSEYEPLEDGSITPTIAQELQSALDGKVDIEEGKGLSQNDLTDERLAELLANTSARHRHYNKAILDAISVPGVEINDAVMKKHAHANKDLLDTYTQTESNLADAVDKKHEHSNYELLESITDEKAAMWDKAEILEDRYAVVDYLGNDTTTIPSSIAVVRALDEFSDESMKSADYDTTGTGNKVDTALNSEKLNGKTEQEIIATHNSDSAAHADLFETKQNKLVAGANITITGNIISAAGGSGGGSTVTITDNPSGGINLIVDGTLKTIAKESDLADHFVDALAHANVLNPLTARVSAIENKESDWDAKSDFSGSYNDLTDKPTIPTVPTDVSAFNNDSGYITDSTLTQYRTSSAQDTIDAGKANKTDITNQFTTVAPTSANTDGFKFAILDSEPATKYDGWIYFIKE